MTFRTILKEEFVDYVKTLYGPTAPVYKNPTPHELYDCTKFTNETSVIGLKGTIKFIVDLDRKRLIAFPGFVIHDTIWRHLRMPGHAGVNMSAETNSHLFTGEGRYDDGKIRFIQSDVLVRKAKTVEEMRKLDWSFANKWFTESINSILNNFDEKSSKAEFEYKLQKIRKYKK